MFCFGICSSTTFTIWQSGLKSIPRPTEATLTIRPWYGRTATTRIWRRLVIRSQALPLSDRQLSGSATLAPMTCTSSLLSADFEGAASDREWQRSFGMNVPANGSSESSNQMCQPSSSGEPRFRATRVVRMKRKGASSTGVHGDSSGSYPMAPDHTLQQTHKDATQFACARPLPGSHRSEEHTSELQSPCNLVCRLVLEKKKKT